jgi:predicted Zn-dependent protease
LPVLAATIRIADNDPGGAAAIYRDGLQRYPQSMALVYGYAEALLAAKRYEQARSFLDSQLQVHASDYKLHGLLARTFSATGKRLQQHRAQAEFYLLQGQLGPAVEQLQFAQQAADGSFFEQSAVDARLRELRRLQAEEAKQKRTGL